MSLSPIESPRVPPGAYRDLGPDPSPGSSPTPLVARTPPALVPDATPPGTGPVGGYEALLETLTEMTEGMLDGNHEIRLLEIVSKLQELQSQVDKLRIDIEASRKRDMLAEKEKQLDEAQKKLDKAREEQENLSVWDKIRLAFQWIGAALAVALGALTLWTGGGLALMIAGAAAITAGITSSIMAVDSSMKAASPDGLGMAGQAARSLGRSLEDARKADEIFGYTMMGISAVSMLVSMGAAFGPAVINAIRGALGKAVIAALENANMGAQLLLKGGQIIEALMTTASAVGEGVVASLEHQATLGQVEGKALQAKAKELEALVEQINEIIDMLVTRAKGTNELFNAVVDSLTDTLNDLAQTLSNLKLQV